MDFFEKTHLKIETKESGRFSHLASFSMLDEILGTQALEIPDIRIVKSDQKIAEHEYLWKRKLVDPSKVAHFFAHGATVIFNSFQDRIESLRLLCTDISSELKLKTQANLYLTPAGSQGFVSHWDTHELFVLQVEGSKKWRIYKCFVIISFIF